jgi:hypothetical protein
MTNKLTIIGYEYYTTPDNETYFKTYYSDGNKQAYRNKSRKVERLHHIPNTAIKTGEWRANHEQD